MPLLGLNGPLSLETGIVYRQQQRRLVVTTTVNNPPPESWQSSDPYASIYVNHDGWNLETSGYGSGPTNPFGNGGHQQEGNVTFRNGVVTANFPLPEYVDLNQLTGPVIAQVRVNLRYYNDRVQNDLYLEETMYVDLHDRNNWRE